MDGKAVRKGVKRREFLKYSTLVLGGSLGLRSGRAVAGMMGGGGGSMGGGGMGGGGTSVIDPPPGALFRDPADAPDLTPGLVSNGRTVVTVALAAAAARVQVAGTTASLLTYNGFFPGPTIRARRDDLLRVRFTNALPSLGTNILGHDRSITNIHTHGLHVSPSGKADNVMHAWMPGDSFEYEYDLSKQEPGALTFYHPHIHGTVAEQYWAGMAGALVAADETAVLAGYETHLMILKDVSLAGEDPAPHASMMDYMHGKEGDIVMVNGQVNPVLPIRPGQVQRWRVLNASNARFYRLSLEGHTIHLIGTDGGLLDKAYPLSEILLSPGERVDLLVQANRRPAGCRLLSLPYARGGGSMGQQVTLLTLSSEGSRVADAIPQVVNTGARDARETPGPVSFRRLVLSMGRGRGYINGVSFTDMDSATDSASAIHSMLGTWEIWEIVNESGMDHPFHQHVNPCQVLSITGGDPGYASLYTAIPAWKDVVIIPKWGSARLLVPVTDYPGMTMYHCHIVEHEDIGMMGVWHIMEEGMGGM